MLKPAGRLCSVLIAAAVLLVSSLATATSALHVTDVEQAAMSTAVVVARVGTSRVGMEPEGRFPLTFHRLEIEEALHGAAPATLELAQYGGEVDGRVHFLSGDAELKPGERCVLFIKHVKSEGIWYLTALAQSKYAIVQHPKRGERLERAHPHDLFVRDADGALSPWSESLPRPVVTIESLREELAKVEPRR